jgi:hypothetical protein
MTENAKTIAFVFIGLLAIVIGLVTRPTSAELDDNQLVGQILTDEFASPDEAKRLRIVRFDEATSELSNFEVAEKNGLWTIPSKNDYPADAAQQMAEAATSLMDRKILGVATKSAADHEEYGVIDPLSPKLEAGQKGVGTRVTMSDVNNKPVVDLIIGKAVKDADQQRFVREADRDIVYIIEIDPTKLSTNFEDWIEKDLLKLNSWDLQQVAVKDYSAELVHGLTADGGIATGINWDRRAEMTFAYNDTDAKWNAVKLQQFEGESGEQGKYVDFALAEDEELNDESLNALKTALDDLQIVDVARKPAGLSQDLKAGTDFLNNNETLLDLMSKGFTALTSQGGEGAEIVSSDGEVIATMKDGTEYVLRFGNLTSRGSDAAQDGEAAAAGTTDPETKAADGSDVNRYLFVMARFNEAAVKQPALEQPPELPAGASETTEKPAERPAGEAAAGEAAPSEEPAGEAATDEAAADEAAADEAATPTGENSESTGEEEPDAPSSPFVDPDQDEATSTEEEEDTPAADVGESNTAGQAAAASENEPAEPASTESDAAASTETQPTDESADATAATTSQDGQQNDNATQSAGESADEKPTDLETIIAEHKRIEQENTRKLDEYQETLKKGRENVKELNLRFGDWYFVVSDDVFKKIRLGRNEVVKKKEEKEEANATPNGGEDDDRGPTDVPSPIPGLPPIPNAGE